MAYFAAADTALASLEARVAALEAATRVGHDVRDYGAVGDGVADDRAAILAAIAAAAGEPVYFPPGTYRLASALTVPDGTTLVGSGMATAWLKGSVRFGSSSSFTDLFIGYGHEYIATAGTHDVTFTRCKFKSADDGYASFWIFNNGASAIYNITLADCLIDSSSNWNGISINAIDGSIHDITFDGCHVLEQARMGFECTNRGSGTKSFCNIKLMDCIFEVQGSEAISFGGNVGAGDNCLVDGCLLKGSGNNPDYPWGQGLENNGRTGLTVRDTTIYRTYSTTLNVGNNCGDKTTTFIGCTFDMSVNYLTRDPSFVTDVNGPSAPMLLSSNIAGWTFENCIFNVGDKVRRRILALEGAATGNDLSTCTFTGGEWKKGTSAVTVRDPGYPEDGNIYPSGTVVEGWGVVP